MSSQRQSFRPVDHGAAQTEQKERISVRVMLMICFMQISACGKVCPKVLAESRRYKEIDRRRARKRKYSLVGGKKMKVVAQSCRRKGAGSFGLQECPGPRSGRSA